MIFEQGEQGSSNIKVSTVNHVTVTAHGTKVKHHIGPGGKVLWGLDDMIGLGQQVKSLVAQGKVIDVP